MCSCLSTARSCDAAIAAVAGACRRPSDPIFLVQPARIAVVVSGVVGGRQDGGSLFLWCVSARSACGVATLESRHFTEVIWKQIRGFSHGSIGVRLLAATECMREGKKGSRRVEMYGVIWESKRDKLGSWTRLARLSMRQSGDDQQWRVFG